MSPAEVARFEQEPYYRAAVRVRQWDDQGKVVGEHADECCYLTKYFSERPQTSSHERCR